MDMKENLSMYDDEAWAGLVREIGLEPYHTESQARRVACHAVEQINYWRDKYNKARDSLSRLQHPDTTGQ